MKFFLLYKTILHNFFFLYKFFFNFFYRKKLKIFSCFFNFRKSDLSNRPETFTILNLFPGLVGSSATHFTIKLMVFAVMAKNHYFHLRIFEKSEKVDFRYFKFNRSKNCFKGF